MMNDATAPNCTCGLAGRIELGGPRVPCTSCYWVGCEACMVDRDADGDPICDECAREATLCQAIGWRRPPNPFETQE